MKDKTARTSVKELEYRVENLETKAVAPYHCPKCGRRTAHEHIYIRPKGDKYYEVSEKFSDCVGLHVVPGRRCLSCGAVHMLTLYDEIQLEG